MRGWRRVGFLDGALRIGTWFRSLIGARLILFKAAGLSLVKSGKRAVQAGKDIDRASWLEREHGAGWAKQVICLAAEGDRGTVRSLACFLEADDPV